MLTTIPFSGFYGTVHEDNLDREVENMVSDSSGCHPISQRIADDIWMHISFPFTEYSKAFTEGFQTLFNGETGLQITFAFESVQSPREYNFQTDRIFAEISFSDLQNMFNKVDKQILDKVTKERFTSYDGFISHYDNDWRTWGSLTNWDHNQIGTLIAALVVQFLDKEWQWNIVEDWSGNGHIGNWVYDGLDDEGKRLVKIADYLRKRSERKYRTRLAS